MRKLLLVPFALMLGVPVFGQVNLPPCSPSNPPPNCTDYFGVANWANSPLPAGAVAGFTVVASGSGYVNPMVVITDATGTGATAGTVTLGAGGAISAVAPGSGGGGYIAPQITIVDVGSGGSLAAPACGGGAGQPACGSGALVTAVLGGPFSGGIHKFVDPLPSLVIATPDTTTFPGADYYEIAVRQYTAKMHTDLPPTTLRGYVQLNNGTGAGGVNNVPPAAISYLGPTIIAQKNRPVRVLFHNQLPTGAGGNLFIPTDTTYMGAGAPYTQNRATLHLHGGATPWISDGTPHQWTVPVGETGGPDRGDSTQLVPDMYFANGVVVPQCSATVTNSCSGGTAAQLPANATNDPGQGSLTFFWTNQQGGRLMFYHDHAYGITRLNVYSGEAAGYLLYDPAEETALAAATVPGTITSAGADLAHLIPLVIQDKTFVPSQQQLAVQDPTWIGNFGATPLSNSGSNGDLWFPHVYMTNQNPLDPTNANAFGRWDYGPWFFPPQTSLTAGPVTVPCTSSAFPNQTLNCPIPPNPSGTPEAFMDTPVVNGKAYPTLHVAPAAYRFKILSAGNDRSLNLQWYVADPAAATEVKMVPAVRPGPGAVLPLCTTINPVAVPSLVIGLNTALLDSSGNPVNGTGLPANCWPNYGPQPNVPGSQTMWAADGRAGGVPDPTTAGPPFIQIGSEGGLLPAPVVIPSTPTGYEANVKSITVGSVGVHGLWLGPAERADVVVDFRLFAGKTLILYNDAPAPAPAIDSRNDYFTGDADQTPIGGAPSTQAGYGPNTRTIMQVVVDGTAPNTTTFSLAALQTALPSVFAQTQPSVIVPEPTYPAASGGYSATQAYSGIHQDTLTYYPLGSTTPVVNTNERKAIQELFTLDYGRMNATLGTELPFVNFNTQTTIPLGYVDPATEIIKQGDTQLWKITHNGVDTHFIHFHLFNVQVVNRVGWDGSMRPPDSNELGWKDTVRMNPLEDILVGLQPITPVPPFPLRDSYRLLDVTALPNTTPGQFTNLNPYTNAPAATPNEVRNFGWEYVWHCHILGHEENDMMRAIAFEVPPEAPSNLVVAPATTGLNLSWTDNSASETGFTLQRATDAVFATNVSTTNVLPMAPDANGQGITYGGTVTYNDTTTAAGGLYFYRVQASKPTTDYWNPGPDITSPWSNIASSGGPIAALAPAALAFGTVALNTASTPQTVTLSNTGSAPLARGTLTITGANAADFSQTNTCPGNMAAGSTCPISVTFKPIASGAESASLVLTTNDPANPTLTVSLTGTGGLPLLTITARNATMKYGSAVPVITPSYSPANPAGLTPPTCTTTATSTSPVGPYPTTCSGAVDANYTIVYVAGTVSVTPVPLSIWAPNAPTTPYGAVPVSFTPSYVGFVAGDTAPAVWLVPGNKAPTCTTTATNTSPVGNKYPITCTGAVDPNYTITYVAGSLTIVKGAMTITAPSPTVAYGAPVPALTPTYSPATPATLATCSTTATAGSAPGTYPVTCLGASDPNYNITYVPGTLTVNKATTTTTITAHLPSPSTLPQPVVVAFTVAPQYTGTPGGNVTVTASSGETCTSTVASGNCTITFLTTGTKTLTAAYAGDLNFFGRTSPGVSHVVVTPASLVVSPNPLAFGDQLVGTNSAPRSVAVSNTGTAAVTFSAFGFTGPFSRNGGSCGATIGVGATCTVNVRFSPLATGPLSGTLTINSTDPGGPVVVALTGNGVAPVAKVSPASLAFSSPLNVTSATQTVTVTNSGTAPLTINNVTRTGTNANQFGQTNNCVGSLAIGATCTITVTFTPTAANPLTKTANLNVVVAAPATNATVTLNGTIVVPTFTLTPSPLAFGTQLRGTTSAPQVVTVANTGAAPLRINNVTRTGAASQYAHSTTCVLGANLAAGGTCTISVTFAPTTLGLKNASLNVVVAAPGTNQSVPLSGTGN